MAPSNKQPVEVKRVRRTTTKRTIARTVTFPDADEMNPEAEYIAPEAPVVRRPSFTGFARTSRKQVNAFLRELIMMLDAGTPILKSMHTLEGRSRGGLRHMIVDITEFIEQGNPLWQALERHPREFTTVDVNLVKASEASGNLVVVLQRIVEYRERREMLLKRVRGAMVYPVILLIVAIGVFALITQFVLPQFQAIFQKIGKDIPPSTQRLLNLADTLANTWWMLILIVVALGIVYAVLRHFSPLWRLRLDRWKLYIPVIGPILKTYAVVQMTRSLALLLKSGMSMMTTLDLTRNTITNRAMANVVSQIHDSVERGAGIEPPLRDNAGVVPPVVTDMLVTGEETGQLDRIAEQIANTYQEELDIKVATIGDALVPIVTVFIGLIVGGLAVSLFYPLINMVQQLGSGGM
ncbi:MAG: type II secretion system F family protein [FCB group bacterium]|jgi:type IV pilus assembly protein PilC|nr:type II secretion system F family protein [FCB group bacterium]